MIPDPRRLLPSRRTAPAAAGYAVPAAAATVVACAAAGAPAWAALATAGAAAAAVTAFFRDPGRDCPADPGVLYAATDGRVMSCQPAGRLCEIAVYVPLTGVHVARAPHAGQLAAWWDRPGGHGPAARAAAAGRNARAEVTIDTTPGPAERGGEITVTLITGAVARRISRMAAPGAVNAGARLGLIHFGSRSVTRFPAARWEPAVRPGQRVTAGVTPVARLRVTP